MDPFWHVRPLFLYPRLFGLVDDMSTLLLQTYWGIKTLDDVHVWPEVAVHVMTLRLVNRENYFFFERRNVANLTALCEQPPPAVPSIARYAPTQPWYKRENFALHVIKNRMEIRIPITLSYYNDVTVNNYVIAAIEVRNLRFLQQILLTSNGSQLDFIVRKIIQSDYAAAYRFVLEKSLDNERFTQHLIRLMTVDAHQCFRIFVERDGPGDVHRILLIANKVLHSQGLSEHCVLIVGAMEEILATRRPTIDADEEDVSAGCKRKYDGDDAADDDERVHKKSRHPMNCDWGVCTS